MRGKIAKVREERRKIERKVAEGMVEKVVNGTAR